jgi:selenide,water dikinase
MGQLAQVLRALPPPTDPRVLVGLSTSDDAGVFRLSESVALVQTVDFFTPVVDDPYAWGTIAAANSLSDVYAMGGRPLTALNVAAFPMKTLPLEILADVLRGAADKCGEAGVAVLGGHTVDDEVPKFGLSVTGVVDPKAIVTNAGARPGDVLVLTKPLGLGIVNSGIKQGHTPPALCEEAVRVMSTLNRDASEAMVEVGVDAATDVTGYGLIGHLWEMCRGADVGAELWLDALPLLPGVEEVRRRGATTSAPRQTYKHLGGVVELAAEVDDFHREILADPQTSGGLLIACPESRLAALLRALERRGVAERRAIGRIVDRPRIAVLAGRPAP